MPRYTSLSETFIRYLEVMLGLIADPLTRMEQKEWQEGNAEPNGRSTVFSNICGISTYFMAQGLQFTPPRAAFLADIDNYGQKDPRNHLPPDQCVDMMQGWLDENYDVWCVPSTLSLMQLVDYDSEKKTNFAELHWQLMLNYARSLLNADRIESDQYTQLMCDLEDFYMDSINATPVRNRYLHRMSIGIINDLELAIIKLVPPLTNLINSEPELAGKFPHARAMLARSVISFMCFMVGLHKVIQDSQLSVLRDITVHFRMMSEKETLDELRAKLLGYLKNVAPMEMPAEVGFLQRYDAGHRTEYARIAQSMYADLAKRVCRLDGAVKAEVAPWLSRLESSVVAAGTAQAEAPKPELESEQATWHSPPIEEAGATKGNGARGASSDARPSPSVSLKGASVEGDDPELDQVLSDLDSLVGLDRVKQDVRELINFLRIQKMREDKGLPTAPISRHLVFYGNPGTGKTTVARLLAQIYKSLGTIELGHLVEADRSKMVGQFVGQTAINVREMVDKAMGGVLFVDEAYTLVSDDRDNFGQEAVDTLLKLMEDKRDKLIVIVAGYTDKMNKFLASNPGLRSRFNKYFFFDDYTPEQLLMIIESLSSTSGFNLTGGSRQKLSELFHSLYQNRDENFGNARDARNIFEKTITHQANRIVRLANIDDRALTEIAAEDVPTFDQIRAMP